MPPFTNKFFEFSKDLLVIGTPETVAKKLSTSWEDVVGWTLDEVYRTPLLDFIHPEDRSSTEKILSEIQKGQHIVNFENRFKHKNQKWIWLMWACGYDQENQLLYATAKDVTQLKKNEERSQRERGRQATLQKMESIARLTGGLAHDFNNLLATIYGHVEMLEKEIPQGHTAFMSVKSIRESSQRATDLTRQLLAFSRQQVLRPSSQSINKLVQQTHQMLMRLLKSNIRVKLSLTTEKDLVHVDGHQIVQVLLSLAMNAQEAMPDGGVLEITTVLSGTKDSLKVIVRDSGLGMDPDVTEKIYEPFFTTKGAGSGMGLSTVYGVIKQSGGAIEVHSQPGQGTYFEMFLPLAPEVHETSLALKPRDASQKLRILLVEDEGPLRLVLTEALKKSGHVILTAENGQEGLKLLQEQFHALDLLITDVLLPELNGVELIKQARYLNPKISVICMSGYASKDLTSSLDFSDIIFMSKPFSLTDLLSKIQECAAATP